MRKFIGLSLLIFIFLSTGWCIYLQNFSSHILYTRVTQDGKMISSVLTRYAGIVHYEYKLNGYDKNNAKQKVTFTTFKDENLKINSYLLLHYNDRRGVLSWEKIKETDIPDPLIRSLRG